MFDALVLDALAMDYLLRADNIQPEWLDSFEISETNSHVALRSVDNIGYLLSNKAAPDSRLLVVRIEKGVLFAELARENRPEALLRVLRAGVATFDSGVEIPTSWRPFHRGSVQSFQSNSFASNEKARLMVDKRPRSTHHAYAFGLDGDKLELKDVKPDWSIFDRAIAGYAQALTQPRQDHAPRTGTRFELELDNRLAREFTGGWTLRQWYESKLTKRQREFVDIPLERSVRLKGPAGTGKTLAMVVKLLLTIQEKRKNKAEFRVAFLTHSMATVEIVRSMIAEMGDSGVLYSNEGGASLDITTLQQLANQALTLDLADLKPLSVDALEGRILQLELINSLIKEFVASDWPEYRNNCSGPIREYIESEPMSFRSRYFAWELMNEFACVLDADGVREVDRRRERYLNHVRAAWMMKLETRSDRELVLLLYSRFRQQLREMGVVGVDQMIADYLGYLNSFHWDAVRRKQGFDVVFVDELHLFNRQERMVFQHLTRLQEKSPVVFMAYDAKQSPRDTFMGVDPGGGEKYNLWKSIGLGQIEQIDLPDVFRYTPQITSVLSCIDQTFPAVDLDEDWPKYRGVSQLAAGPAPISTEVQNVKAMYELVFPRASSWVRRSVTGRKVAILCLSAETFEIYLKAGQHKDRFIPITSREELTNIRYAGRRFVFSRPEYVAGLQFEIVLLIDVNESEISSGGEGIGAKRRFVSELYLGASRAEAHLEFYSNRERGGAARALQLAISEGVVDFIKPDQLPRPDSIDQSPGR